MTLTLKPKLTLTRPTRSRTILVGAVTLCSVLTILGVVHQHQSVWQDDHLQVLWLVENVRNSILPMPSPSPARELEPEDNHLNSNNGYTPEVLPHACTSDQLDVIQRHLPSDACLRTRTTPWKQMCSITQNTKCPDATWIDNYYHHHQQRQQNQPGRKFSFLGISVGCNKAFDAVEAMRRGSRNPKFDKAAWRQAMQDASGGQMASGVCNQELREQFHLTNHNHSHSGRHNDSQRRIPENAEMHCVEPMPVTAQALQRAAQQLRYDTDGFIVTHAAIAKQSGSTYFPRASLSSQAHMTVKVGSENQGIDSCGDPNTAQTNPKCLKVPMYSLDEYAQKFIRRPPDDPIHILSIDVEGYDYDVILGGMNDTLPRVEYLEFEYNWMGSWKTQTLQDAIQKLDSLHFSCYWAGSRGRLWRITNCFLDYYNVKHWSNVACVNRRRVPQLAADMERIFEQTLLETA